MKLQQLIACCLIFLGISISAGSQGQGLAASGMIHPRFALPPVHITDGTFLPQNWTVTADVTGGATYTVTQQLDDGFGGGPYRFMSHRLPPVTGNILATVAVTHIYLGASYHPNTQGPITNILYQEIGRILSFPFPDAFSTTQPVVVQSGRVFRSQKFIRFIAQNSSHYWEVEYIDLIAADFVAVDGSGEHPDFSVSGGPIQFGFTRTNSRGSTLPPVPSDQDMVIDQGVDEMRISVYRDSLPVQAVDDVFILNGFRQSLPLFSILDVTANDAGDIGEIFSATQSLYGSVSFTGNILGYSLNEAETFDTFSYAIQEYGGGLTSSADVKVIIDCACSVLCLNQLEPPPPPGRLRPDADAIDLPLLYQVRDFVLKPTTDGNRYVDMYYKSNPEILINLLASEQLRADAIATVELWQPNLRNLVYGDGEAVITQAQVDAIESFLAHLSALSSLELQQLIASELQRLGPLDAYAGLTVKAAKSRAIGDAMLYLPLIIQ